MSEVGTAMRTCECLAGWTGPEYCGEEASVVVRAMCVHEHLSEAPACWGCLSDMRKICGDEEWECVRCGDSPSPHVCPMPMQVTEMEPS